LLNFDAYSFPDVGGWIVFAAGCLAFTVWFVEWYRHRKSKTTSTTIPKMAVAASCVIFFFSSCTAQPEPFRYGKDVCDFCKMGIVDPKFGGELVTKKGKVYKFDDLNCMINYLKTGALKDAELSHKLVINYNKQNDFLNVEESFFVVNPDFKTPMGSNTAGFASKPEADKTLTPTAKQLRWDELYKQMD
jgi:copper chaperone NosL